MCVLVCADCLCLQVLQLVPAVMIVFQLLPAVMIVFAGVAADASSDDCVCRCCS